MALIRDMARLGKQVAARHGWAAAKAFKAYRMSEADQAALSHCAVELLRAFPDGFAASAAMSAALALALERVTDAPVQVVAGTLLLDDAVLFGTEPEANRHVWIMIGPYVVDISIFRIAASPDAPDRLVRHIDLTFGRGKALYVDQWRRTARLGLRYEPEHVMDADEITALMGGAYEAIQKSRESSVSSA